MHAVVLALLYSGCVSAYVRPLPVNKLWMIWQTRLNLNYKHNTTFIVFTIRRMYSRPRDCGNWILLEMWQFDFLLLIQCCNKIVNIAMFFDYLNTQSLNSISSWHLLTYVPKWFILISSCKPSTIRGNFYCHCCSCTQSINIWIHHRWHLCVKSLTCKEDCHWFCSQTYCKPIYARLSTVLRGGI